MSLAIIGMFLGIALIMVGVYLSATGYLTLREYRGNPLHSDRKVEGWVQLVLGLILLAIGAFFLWRVTT